MALTTTSCTVTELMTAARGSVVFLGALIRSADGPPPGELHELAAEILRCCNRALAALSAGGVANAAGGGAKKRKMEHGATTALPVRSRRRVDGEEAPRKVVKSRTIEDGFIWRKYGQKEIRNYNYPRLYFRCTYKHDQACKAARQVQQSQEDPSLYVITYFGEHTCREEAMDEEGSQRFIIDFGSSTPRTTDRHGDSPFSEVTHEQPSYDGEVRGETSWGWPLEEHVLDARLQGVAGIEEATPAASWPNGCYTSPGLESLGSCLGSEPGVGFFDFGDLVTFDQIDLFQ